MPSAHPMLDIADLKGSNRNKSFISKIDICMLRQKAQDYFLGKGVKKLNCAQSIMAAIDPENGSNEVLLNKFAKYGGGRAPEGWCGPAYVASLMFVKKEVIEKRYTERVGSVKCAEIRKNGKMPCEVCVELGVELIEESIESK